ncbi:hypothetical protein AU255_09360 [Methyloprofundus sedimenti]|uniref:Uncharacterized protein n=1 Tax=Methyloprofundus sedimenti TaxID=1420851 RepID=A0A1V8M970_9GAMM|nr:hypothetical protein [Methyloprofundus sedimenti]OQK18042.1 hypothetical protein AU255_09360 [Methyloprofundus sedimenti]
MFKITELNEHYETLAYIGHVNNVIEGVIPENLINRRFLASDFEYGFELASPQGIFNLGESILLNGMIYSSRTDISRSERDPLMWGPEFVTSGIFLIPKGTKPNLNAKFFSFEGQLTLADLYQAIFDKIQCPFAVVGCVELSKVYAKSITRAPIHHENIFKNAQEYYTEKDYIEDNVNLAITAVVSDHNDPKMTDINEKLSSVLYYNPFAKNNNLLAHTHALLLNKPIIDIEEVRPKNAKEVLHLLDHSIIRYVNFKIYRISDLTCIAS